MLGTMLAVAVEDLTLDKDQGRVALAVVDMVLQEVDQQQLMEQLILEVEAEALVQEEQQQDQVAQD